MRVAAFLIGATLAAQPANEPFLKWMDERAQKLLAERDRTIAAIKTPAQIEERKKYVRAKILELIGGLPDYRGPLNAKVTWTKDRGRYVVEGVLYESLPNYWVSANLYRPKTAGKHPAVLFPLGHWDQGKAAAQRIAANLALKGFIVLAFDPIGQGERLQAYDSRIGKSVIGGSTEQHFMAGALAVIAGENVARYFIWDGMRGIDYLQSRPEVDGERIGCTGCSGGGTQTTYISALDPRVKAAAPACYMQSFKLLFTGPVGDSEQSFPGFLSSGLDQTDYVELFSPKPWLIASTEEDFFTPAAAKPVYEEARNWYETLGVQDRVKWVVGPGPHGTPLIVREAIYDWMIRWLKSGEGSAKEEAVELIPDMDLRVTESGRVPGTELFQVIRDKMKPSATVPKLPEETYPVDSVLLEGSGDTAVVVVETAAVPGARSKQIAARGVTVLSLNPRGRPVEPYRVISGDWAANERAWLIGRNLPLLRASDISAAVRSLRQRPGVRRVLVHAPGVGGWWALYAFANDPGIDRLWVDRTPYSLRQAFEYGVHTDLHDAVIPGVLPEFRPGGKILWTDPTDWMRNTVKLTGGYVYRNIVVDDDDRRLIDLFLAR